MIPFKFKDLSFNAKKALTRGILVGAITMAVYLAIVVITTPNLPPVDAIRTALTINALIIVGTSLGIGAQYAMSNYSKSLGCSLRSRKSMIGAGSGSTAFSSFLSFFSLVPLGCCGSWLFILSLLPSIFGTSISATLIQYSTPLAYLGLAIVASFTAMTAIRLRRELRKRDGLASSANSSSTSKLSSIRNLAFSSGTGKLATLSTLTMMAIAISILAGYTLTINPEPGAENANNAEIADAASNSMSETISSNLLTPQTSQAQEQSIVPIDQILSGGPPRDGIPSIDNPKFVPTEESSTYLEGSDIIVGLEINGDVRAYPLNILVWHEIVNDVVGGVPVAITYCPLCFTVQVFERTIDDKVIEFGTSGKLYNSNLVMYDRTNESLWSQGLGIGIVGIDAGKDLKILPFDLAFWKEWKQLYPQGKVLSKDTGFGRPYGVDPYGDYYVSNDIFFPVTNRDDRLGLKEIVIGFEQNEQFKAYSLTQVERAKVINDDFADKSILLASLQPFMVRAFDRTIQLDSNSSESLVLDFEHDSINNLMVDNQTGSKWNFEGKAVEGILKEKTLTRLPLDEGFWFSWVAFHPETKLYPN